MQTTIANLLTATLVFVAAGLLAFVLGTSLPDGAAPMRLPVVGGEGATEEAGVPALDQGELTTSGGKATGLPGEWRCFRGAGRDAISGDEVALLDGWAEGEPKVLWSVELGEGYAGGAVLGGQVYLSDYDREAMADAVRCLSLDDGEEIWRFSYPVSVKRNHGMSRTVPAVTEKHVVSLGPKCHVSCLDAVSGEFQWGIDLVREHGTIVPAWYAGQCPLIDGDRVILAPSGSSLMIACDLATGEVIWKTPNPMGWKMTHVSITPMEVSGRKTYVYCGHRGVAGVAADDGSLLWETGEWRISLATVSSPVAVPGNRIFLSGGYEAGSMMIEVAEQDGKWEARTLFRIDADVFGATQQTPVLYEGHLFGVRPNGELVCLDLSGKVLWASGMAHRFGLGPFMVADGKIFVMDDDGELTMAEATAKEFRLLGRSKVLDGHDSWGPLAIAGGRLLARDLTRMVCLDVKKP